MEAMANQREKTKYVGTKLIIQASSKDGQLEASLLHP